MAASNNWFISGRMTAFQQDLRALQTKVSISIMLWKVRKCYSIWNSPLVCFSHRPFRFMCNSATTTEKDSIIYDMHRRQKFNSYATTHARIATTKMPDGTLNTSLAWSLPTWKAKVTRLGWDDLSSRCSVPPPTRNEISRLNCTTIKKDAMFRNDIRSPGRQKSKGGALFCIRRVGDLKSLTLLAHPVLSLVLIPLPHSLPHALFS